MSRDGVCREDFRVELLDPCAGLAQDNTVDLGQETGLLGQRDKLICGNHPLFGMNPPDQRLEAVHRPVLEV